MAPEIGPRGHVVGTSGSLVPHALACIDQTSAMSCQGEVFRNQPSKAHLELTLSIVRSKLETGRDFDERPRRHRSIALGEVERLGGGVTPWPTRIDFGQGSLEFTEDPLHAAIRGDGFFVVRDGGDGE